MQKRKYPFPVMQKVFRSLYKKIRSENIPSEKLKQALERAHRKGALPFHSFASLLIELYLRAYIRTKPEHIFLIPKTRISQIISELEKYRSNKNRLKPSDRFLLRQEIYKQILPTPYDELFKAFYTHGFHREAKLGKHYEKFSWKYFHDMMKEFISKFGENSSKIARVVAKAERKKELEFLDFRNGIPLLQLHIKELNIQEFVAIEGIENGRIKIGDAMKHLVRGTEAEGFFDSNYFAKKEESKKEIYEKLSRHFFKYFTNT